MEAFAFRGFHFSSVLACLCVSFPGAACPFLWLPSFFVVGFSIGGSCRSSVSRFPLSIRPYPFHGFVFPPPFLFFIRLRFPLPVLFLRFDCGPAVSSSFSDSASPHHLVVMRHRAEASGLSAKVVRELAEGVLEGGVAALVQVVGLEQPWACGAGAVAADDAQWGRRVEERVGVGDVVEVYGNAAAA